MRPKKISVMIKTDHTPGRGSSIMIMGVTACGKTEIGQRLAPKLGARFIECDALHPEANIDKMQRGLPLTDEDRWPWLEALSDEVCKFNNRQEQVVFSCSALKRVYRDHLRRRLPDLVTVFLDLDHTTSQQRLSSRSDHFMPISLVASQFATLERPEGEFNTLTLDARAPIEAVVQNVLAQLEAL